MKRTWWVVLQAPVKSVKSLFLSPALCFAPPGKRHRVCGEPTEVLWLFHVCENCGGGKLCSVNPSALTEINRLSIVNMHHVIVSLFSSELSVLLHHAMFVFIFIFPKITRIHFSPSLFRQNLVVEGELYPVILNTHFSQKVCVEADNAACPRSAVSVEKCRPPQLTRCLWRSETSRGSSEKSVSCEQVSCGHRK